MKSLFVEIRIETTGFGSEDKEVSANIQITPGKAPFLMTALVISHQDEQPSSMIQQCAFLRVIHKSNWSVASRSLEG